MVNERNHMLDGLRGIAALLVVAFHAGIILQRPVLPGAYLAVDFFFALSGFVLASRYDGIVGRTMSAWQFMQRRIIRLYPLFLLGALLGIAKMFAQQVLLASSPMSGASLLAAVSLNLAMMPCAWGNNPLFPLNVPAWSLFFELAINLAFASLLLRSKPSRCRILVCLSGIALLMATSRSGVGMDFGWNSLTFALGFVRVAFSFTLGVLIARSAPAVMRPQSLLAFLFVAIMPLAFTMQAGGSALSIRDIMFTFVLSPVMLLAATEIEAPTRFQALFGFLGDISYPIYVVHYPILMATSFLGIHSDLPFAITFLLGLICSIGAAVFVENYIDRPVRYWVSQKLCGPASQPTRTRR